MPTTNSYVAKCEVLITCAITLTKQFKNYNIYYIFTKTLILHDLLVTNNDYTHMYTNISMHHHLHFISYM